MQIKWTPLEKQTTSLCQLNLVRIALRARVASTSTTWELSTTCSHTTLGKRPRELSRYSKSRLEQSHLVLTISVALSLKGTDSAFWSLCPELSLEISNE